MLINRRLMLAASAAALAIPASPLSAAPNTAGDAKALYDAFMDEILAAAPELATSLGLDTAAKASLRAKLSDRSLQGRAGAHARDASMLKRLQMIDRKALSGLDATNYDAVLYGLEQQNAADQRFAYGTLGNPYAVNQLGGAYYEIPDFLDSQHPVETKADAEAYLTRLGGFAEALDGENETIRHDASSGAVPPDFVIAATLKQLKALRAIAPEKNSAVGSLVRRAREKHIDGPWGEKAAAIVREKVWPALERQIALFESLQPSATHDAGAWRLPDGEAFYAASLANQTTTAMSPAEVHQMGLDVVAECTAACETIMSAHGLTKGSVGMRLRAMFEDPKFRYDNTDAAKEKLIGDLNTKLAEVTKLLPQYFSTLPKAPVSIKRVPKYIETSAPGGYYQNASLDGKRPGIYYINLRDTAEVPSWTLPTLTFHEAIPGHHMQISIAQETDLPLIRRISGYNAYVEGWALYAEQLAVEMGLYQNDPWGEIGQLHDAMLRGVRLVVDTGLHSMRWSREKAVAYYAATLGDPESGAVTEIERYCVWPGQACGYMVGKRFILALRQRAKAALASRFNIKAFHETILSSGALPLDTLSRVTDSYITAAKA